MKLARVASVGILAMAAAMWAGPMVRGQAVTNPRQALGQTIHELKVDGTSLERVINFLRDSSGTNIVVDWKVLEGVGVTKDTPISIQVKELPMQKMLQLVLDQASPNTHLVFNIDSNVLQVTTQDEADKNMITKVYIVDDLVMVANMIPAPQLNLQNVGSNTGTVSGSGGGGFGGSAGGGGIFNQTGSQAQNKQTQDQKGQELVDLVTSVIRPNIWSTNGGTASIKYFAGKLIVTAPASVHEALGGPVETSGIRFGS